MGVIKTGWEVFWILFDLALYSKATDLKSLDHFSYFLGLAFRKGDKTKVSEIFTLGGTVLVFLLLLHFAGLFHFRSRWFCFVSSNGLKSCHGGTTCTM
jgi:hypothetical protein